MSNGNRRQVRVLVAAAAIAAIAVATIVGIASRRLGGRDVPDGLRAVTYRVGDRDMRYVEGGRQDGPTVVFIHGSPGSWSAFEGMLRDPALAARARLVAVDRPGFGGSGRGRPVISIREQAELLGPAIGSGRSGTVILVGHSMGAPVAASLGAAAPDRVGGLVLISASIDPDLEVVRWYQKAALIPEIARLVPVDVRTANVEILPMAWTLRQIAPDLASIAAPVVVIHGARDRLVPVANVYYATRMLTAAEVRVEILPDEDHFIPWTRPEVVRDAVLSLLDR